MAQKVSDRHEYRSSIIGRSAAAGARLHGIERIAFAASKSVNKFSNRLKLLDV